MICNQCVYYDSQSKLCMRDEVHTEGWFEQNNCYEFIKYEYKTEEEEMIKLPYMFQNLFKKDYKVGNTYSVDVKKILIKPCFLKHRPSRAKLAKKKEKFKRTGELGTIKLNRNFELTDGYISYIICLQENIKKVEVIIVED